MQSNREVFLRMTEEHYMSIPNEIRMVYLSNTNQINNLE